MFLSLENSKIHRQIQITPKNTFSFGIPLITLFLEIETTSLYNRQMFSSIENQLAKKKKIPETFVHRVFLRDITYI